MFHLLVSLLFFVVKSQFSVINSPKLCLEGDCVWNCPGYGIGGQHDCKDIYYCGPKTTSCVMNCGKGGCNSEIGIISHSPKNLTVNCIGEAVCNKMLVNCGVVNPTFIQNLNNLPGVLGDLFQNMIPQFFQTSVHAPYGKCTINCGHKSCQDLNYICQGTFQDGKGCTLNAQALHPTFENGYFHCALPNSKSHCSANCGISFVNGQYNVLPNLPPYFIGQIGGTADHACHNGIYACYQGTCYCDGVGCNREFHRNGVIRKGRPPKLNKNNTQTKKRIPKIGNNSTSTNETKFENLTKKEIIQKRILKYIHNLDSSLFIHQIPGFDHYECGIGLSNCKIVCGSPRACSGKTIIAHSNIDQLVIECSEYSCVGMNVTSNAIYTEIKCNNECGCSGANIVCGSTKSKKPLIFGQIEKCAVSCTNAGCAKCHNPTNGYNNIKGTSLNCGRNVLRCELDADSQNGNVNYQIPQFGKPVHPLAQAQGSFDLGEINCNVEPFIKPKNPFVRHSPPEDVFQHAC